MSALVRKDCCVLWKQMRIFLVVILFIAVFNGAFGNVFIVVWASMMPFTAMAYDERSKWDQLAAMMPYSVRDIVLSKYVLGWLCMGAAALASLAIQGILTAVHAPMASLDCWASAPAPASWPSPCPSCSASAWSGAGW